MPIYEITSCRGGLSDYEDKGIPGAFKFGANLNIRKEKDSISCNQALADEGLDTGRSPSLSISPSVSVSATASATPSWSASPTSGASPSPSVTPSVSVSKSPSVTASLSVSLSPSPTAGLTTVFEDLVRFFVKCSDGYTYGFGSTGCIYRRDADAFWQRVYKDPDGAIKGAEEMPAAGNKTFLGWCTNTKVKKKQIPGLSSWNDVTVVSSSLASQDWHTMKQVGGATKIANGSFLGLVGYDESFTNEALDLIPGNMAKTLVERNGKVIIGTFKTGYPTKGINAAIDAEVPLAQIGDEGDIYYANGTNSVAVKTLPGGGIVNPGGMANEVDQVNFFEWEETALSWIDKQSVGNMALMAVYNAESGKGGVYTYGRKNKNHPIVLNLEYQLDADELGAVVNVDGTTLVSYRDGTDFGVKAVDPDNKATGIYEGLDFRSPVKMPSHITNWRYAEVFMDPLPNGASVAFYYRVNKTGDFVLAYTGSGGTSYNTVSGDKAVFRIGAEGEIFEPRLVLTPYANLTPEIHRIRVFFQ